MDALILGFEKYETPFKDKVYRLIEFSRFEKNPKKIYFLCATGDSFIHNDNHHLGNVFDKKAYSIAKIVLKYKILFTSFKYMPDGADIGAEIERSENVRNGTRIFTQDFLKPLNMVSKLVYE